MRRCLEVMTPEPYRPVLARLVVPGRKALVAGFLCATDHPCGLWYPQERGQCVQAEFVFREMEIMEKTLRGRSFGSATVSC